jgi:dTMP kinase
MSIFNRTRFITFEGIDGCGKSTQARLLLERLQAGGLAVILVREPGGTQISEAIRQILLHRDTDELADRTEALLMTASRAQLTREVILPALQAGKWVIADRYADSTLAYQGGGRGLDLDWLIQLNSFATYDLFPDISFFIDILPEVALRRQAAVRDRIEREGADFQTRVRATYLEIIKRFPERFVAVDGHRAVEEIHEQIWQELIRRHFISNE